jgi:hypothetical protein
MEKARAEEGQGQLAQTAVDCKSACIRDELEESELMTEGGDEEQSFLKFMTTSDLAISVASFSDFFQLYESHCCTKCQRFEDAKALLPQFRAYLQEARDELKRRKPLKEI